MGAVPPALRTPAAVRVGRGAGGHPAVPREVVYCESVDERTFVYTSGAVFQTALSLAELEDWYGGLGLFRAGKSAVVNLHHIRTLKSRPGGRIEAALETGEKLMVSRHYAPLLRERLGL